MDRVSSLPETVLCHILSFLPTKDAALSSVLSKRWLNLWKRVPNLDIDDSIFLHPEKGKGKRSEIRQSFVDFVDRVLTFQGDSPIEKFSLKSTTIPVHPDCLNRWICNVLRRGVSELDLFIDCTDDDFNEEDKALPKELFVSKTLVKLKLRSEICVDWWYGGSGASLPMLKSLDIDSSLIFLSGEMKDFLPSFPVLEELGMASMEWREMDITLSSASLKRLSLHGTGCEGGKMFQSPKSVSFDTPMLFCLNYTDAVAEDYPLVNMENLFQARINFIVTDKLIKQVRAPNDDWSDDDDDEGNVVLRFGNIVKLMYGIQNVRNLYFTANTLEMLSLCCESMPVFYNVKFLELEVNYKLYVQNIFSTIPDLVRSCPNLEYLVIEGLLHYVTDKCGDFCDCIPRGDKGRSLTSCPVTKLEIRGFKGTMRELDMIRHFLSFFRCLNEVGIFPEEDGPTNFENPGVLELVEKILDLYDELSSCDVVFVVDNHMRRKWTAQSSLRV